MAKEKQVEETKPAVEEVKEEAKPSVKDNKKISESKIEEKLDKITTNINPKDTKKEEVAGDITKPVEIKEEKPIKEFRESREERAGIAYIHSTPNNTFVHITDLSGNTISRISGGMITKHSRLKADPTIAMFAAKKAAERAKDLGINALYVRIKGKTGAEFGVGPGAHSAVKSLDKEGFKIINILDTTKVARGGPKKKGGKRGRRV